MSSEDVMDVEAAGLAGMDVEAAPGLTLLTPTPSPALPVSNSLSSVVNDARGVVVKFLAEHLADEIVPESSRVVVLDSDVSLLSALRALFENGVRAAPVADRATARYVGMFTVSDVIAALAAYRYEPGGDVSRVLAATPLREWLMQESPRGGTFHCANAASSLLDACQKLRHYRIHRLPVAAGGTVLCTLEHWRVLRFVHRHLAGREDPRAAALFAMTIAQLGVGTFSGLVTVREGATLMDVLDVLIERKLSAVPIVGDDGKLKDVYSRTDITALARGSISIASLEVNVLRALSSQRPRGFCMATCRQDDTLRTVFETFERTRKHRLYAVNEHGVLNGVLSLSDLLAYFLNGV